MHLPNNTVRTDAYDSGEPTAKAYLQIDLSTGSTVTGEISGRKADKLIRPLARFGAQISISVGPAITLTAAHGFLSDAQATAVIVLQLAASISKRGMGERRKLRSRSVSG